jgi:hypothetical protein
MVACLHLSRSLETPLSWATDACTPVSPVIGDACQEARWATSARGMGIALLRA